MPGPTFPCPVCGEKIRVRRWYARVLSLLILTSLAVLGVRLGGALDPLLLLIVLAAGALPVSVVAWSFSLRLFPPPMEKHRPGPLTLFGDRHP
jgi:hypothetical protein